MSTPTILILLGGIGGAAASVWASILGEQRSKFKSWPRRYHVPALLIAACAICAVIGAELAATQSERETRETRESMTGGEAACFLNVDFDENGERPVMGLILRGDLPIYDVKMLIFDLAGHRSDYIVVGDLWPNRVWMAKPASPVFEYGDHDYFVDFTARNGAWQEQIQFRLVDGKLQKAIRAAWVRADAKTIQEEIDPAFPRSQLGEAFRGEGQR